MMFTRTMVARLNVRPEMKQAISIGYRRPRESGGPEQPFEPCGPWVPAFAGMTDKTVDFAEIIVVRALNDLHPQNQRKAKFFMLFGFMLTNWQELRKALLDHPHNNPVVNQTTFQYGEIYEIGCSIASPDGRKSLCAIILGYRTAQHRPEIHHRIRFPSRRRRAVSRVISRQA